MAVSPVTDVVFDFCGVLINRQVTRTLEGVCTPSEISEFFAYDDRSGFHYYDDLLDRGMGVNETCRRYEDERGGRLSGLFRTYCENLPRGLVGMIPGMEGLLRDLREQGVRAWGLTNWGRETFSCVYERFPQLRELLCDVIVSGREGVAKPDEGIYRLACARFGLVGEKTLFFDDNAINVSAARAVGLRGHVFVGAAGARRELRRAGIMLPSEPEGVLSSSVGADAEVPSLHDGASACETAERNPGTTVLSPCRTSADGLREDGIWRAVPLGSLLLPSAPNPRAGHYGDSFWAERASEYRALQWRNIDWELVRAELGRAARQLAVHPEAEPSLELAFETIRERTFLEMWFGYGDPCIEAFPTGDGRFRIGYGQHRICPVANFPLSDEDAARMGFSDGRFSPGGPLPADTLLPVLVRKRREDGRGRLLVMPGPIKPAA